MPAIKELKGRGLQASENAFRRRRYYVYRTESEKALGTPLDELTATTYAYSYLVTQTGTDPPTLLGLTLRSLQADEELDQSWIIEANFGSYQTRIPPAAGESQYNFEISSQTAHVVVPIGTQTVFKRGSDPFPLPTGIHLIGDQGLGEPPAGCDVMELVWAESETHYFADSVITTPYKDAIGGCVGKMNSGTFKGRAAGEALFVGCTGSKRGQSDWEVTFRWLVRKNQASLVVAGITITGKRGWDYIWPRYREKYAADGSFTMTNEITHMVKSQVVEEADFDDLAI